MRLRVLLFVICFFSPFSPMIVNAESRPTEVCSTSSRGRLGKPLGVRQTIAGTFADRVMLPNPLAVVELDGALLTSSIPIEIRGQLKIEQGKRYSLEGYESGEFTGPPEWLSTQLVQQPFQFRSFFVVTRILGTSTWPNKN